MKVSVECWIYSMVTLHWVLFWAVLSFLLNSSVLLFCLTGMLSIEICKGYKIKYLSAMLRQFYCKLYMYKSKQSLFFSICFIHQCYVFMACLLSFNFTQLSLATVLNHVSPTLYLNVSLLWNNKICLILTFGLAILLPMAFNHFCSEEV